ncbi:MAG: hypothetical protein RR280_07255 [Bacteroidaceae bacterium]
MIRKPLLPVLASRRRSNPEHNTMPRVGAVLIKDDTQQTDGHTTGLLREKPSQGWGEFLLLSTLFEEIKTKDQRVKWEEALLGKALQATRTRLGVMTFGQATIRKRNSFYFPIYSFVSEILRKFALKIKKEYVRKKSTCAFCA